MPDFASSPDSAVSHAVIPGAGSAGLTWEPASRLLSMRILPVPDEPSVPAMAAALAAQVAELPEPRVLTGASLGGMGALEVEKLVPVQGLILIATGFGITVGESLLEWVAANPPDLFEKMAGVSLADRENRDQVALAARAGDLGSGGPQRAARRPRGAGAQVPRRAGARRGRRSQAVLRAAGGDGQLDALGGVVGSGGRGPKGAWPPSRRYASPVTRLDWSDAK